MKPGSPKAIKAAQAPPRARPSGYLEIGERTPGDGATYPDDDLQAVLGSDGKWRYLHKDGTAY